MVKKTKDLQYYEAIGRRKEAVARVRLYVTGRDKTVTVGGNKLSQGEILINKKPVKELFPHEHEQQLYLKPFRLTGTEGRFATSVLVKGGGQHGQLEAMVLGFSRALEKVDSGNREPLKKEGLLTRDPRIRERRKVGTGGKARRQKQSPKR